MLYCVYAYTLLFIATITLRLYSGRASGILLLLISVGLHYFAFWYYAYEWERLAGEPDLLYVWISPCIIHLMAFLLTFIVIIRILSIAYWFYHQTSDNSKI